MKYLKLRGDWFHFERVVQKELRGVLGRTAWREALNTDSRVEAEIRCRRRTVETDEDIRQAKEGTFRRISDHNLDDIAVQWGIDFQQINRENIARDAFPDVWDRHDKIGDETPKPIFRSKSELAKSVSRWLTRVQCYDVIEGSSDWTALIEACLDEYLVSNPEISNAWVEIHTEQENIPSADMSNVFGTVVRTPKIDPKHKLSIVFKSYLKINKKLGASARTDFATSVRRFIEFHGDMDVTLIRRVHAEQFRDGLMAMPVRPPHKIRALNMKKQIAWAEVNAVKHFEKGTLNKNLLGVKLTLDFAFEETSIFEDRNWRSPFDGFIKSVGPSKNPIQEFTPAQLSLIFSQDVYVTKSAERFWIPLVLLFTGARLDEICQLHADDVKQKPIPHILTENLEDEDPALAKKLKSISSHRTIPIHADLIELGFLDYAKAIRAKGHLHLFPDLRHEKGRDRGSYLSRVFMKTFRDYGAKHPTTGLNTLSLRTHSLRHSFRMAGFEVPDQQFVEIVMGHFVSGSSIQNYGPKIYKMPEVLNLRVTSIIPMPEIDMIYLKARAREYLTQVHEIK